MTIKPIEQILQEREIEDAERVRDAREKRSDEIERRRKKLLPLAHYAATRLSEGFQTEKSLNPIFEFDHRFTINISKGFSFEIMEDGGSGFRGYANGPSDGRRSSLRISATGKDLDEAKDVIDGLIVEQIIYFRRLKKLRRDGFFELLKSLIYFVSFIILTSIILFFIFPSIIKHFTSQA